MYNVPMSYISSALDWGGVSREFFELLCVECFDASNRLFRRFKDNPQGLVGILYWSLLYIHVHVPLSIIVHKLSYVDCLDCDLAMRCMQKMNTRQYSQVVEGVCMH